MLNTDADSPPRQTTNHTTRQGILVSSVYRAIKRFASEAIHPPLGGATTLDAYMARYGAALGQQSQESLRPLHVPGRDAVLAFSECKRQPFPAQQHIITAVVKHLLRDKSVIVSGECGTGKSLCMMLMAHKHAQQRTRGRRVLAYTGLVLCPGQLPDKWDREIRDTLPNVDVVQVRTWRDAVRISKQRPSRPTWYILPRDRAKLNAGWKAVYLRRRGVDGVCCPQCGQQVIDEKTNAPMSLVKIKKNRTNCPQCSTENNPTPLWQWISKPRRWAPAQFIKDHLSGRFDYLVVDELHQYKGKSIQGDGMGKLASACEYFIGGTGTVIGGQADHLRLLLWRASPASLTEDGFEYDDYMPFSERYGRIETRVTEKQAKGADFQFGKGAKRQVAKSVRPGIMPTLFGRHLIDKTVFLSLEDVAEGLPSYEEILVPVQMDAETAEAYKKIEDALRLAITPMVARGDRRLLGRMLSILLGYPDHPHGFGSVGYMDGDHYEHVVDCPNLDAETLRPKEKALLDMLQRENADGNQVWNYCQMTDKRDVMDRLSKLAEQRGLRTKILRSKAVKLEDREAWISQHGPTHDCMFSHPQLVETGLDLFDKSGGHNFNALAFYEQGYNPFIMRQASRRAWRIGQKKPCRVYFFYYVGTMQERAMSLMGKKLAASLALEGKFSSEGLAAMAGEDSGLEMALAKSLAEKLDDLDAARHWKKVSIHAPNAAADKPFLLDSSPVETDKRFNVQPFKSSPATPSAPATPTRTAAAVRKPKPIYRQRVLSAFD